MTTENPDLEDRAKFLVSETRWLVGYTDMLATAVGDAEHAEGNVSDAEDAVRNLELSFKEGVERNMQNTREHGAHPIQAFKGSLTEDWPLWLKVELAESQHHIFEGDPEFMTDEEIEYLDWLEEKYDVPR